MLLKKKKEGNHQPKSRSLPSSSTKQSAQQRAREQHTQGTTSPLKPLLYSSDGARSCRLLFAVSAAVRTWCGGETSTSKRVRVLVTRCSSKKSKTNHQPKNRALPSSSTKQSAQQRVREQHTQGTTSPLKPLLSLSLIHI